MSKMYIQATSMEKREKREILRQKSPVFSEFSLSTFVFTVLQASFVGFLTE